jgi:hypothetical protein
MADGFDAIEDQISSFVRHFVAVVCGGSSCKLGAPLQSGDASEISPCRDDNGE